MITNLTKNWKTTSVGATMVGGAIIHLVFAIKNKTADENTWTITFGAIIGGLGFVFAGDADKSATKDEVQVVATNVQAVNDAVRTGDTSMLVRPVQNTTTETPK